MNRENGISLLELLLFIVVAASIVLLSVRYLSESRLNLKVDQSIEQIQKITNAGYQWLQSRSQLRFDNSGSNNAVNISMSQLLATHLLSNLSSDTQDAWGGAIAVSPAADPAYLSITLPNVPNNACQIIMRKLSGTAHQQNCLGSRGYYGVF